MDDQPPQDALCAIPPLLFEKPFGTIAKWPLCFRGLAVTIAGLSSMRAMLNDPLADRQPKRHAQAGRDGRLEVAAGGGGLGPSITIVAGVLMTVSEVAGFLEASDRARC